MLEGQLCCAPHLALVDAHPEAAVVAHAHHVPREVVRLRVVALVPRPAAYLARVLELVVCQLDVPEDPAPVLVPGAHLLEALDVAQAPRQAVVERDLHARHLAPAAAVRVALHSVRALLVVTRHGELLLVVRVPDGAVNVELVEDVLGLVPPVLLRGQLGVHVWRNDPVVVEVVEVIRLARGHRQLLEPLHHAPADVARDDDAHGEAVVWAQPLAVVLVGEDDVVVWVERHRERD
mmetsp:Transcript_21658/g.73628  ORF Transcript_21658/g.73628 Transcript_21658/m.73628 type:complete len:235 (-) Transcript_21658:738-1442(-)